MRVLIASFVFAIVSVAALPHSTAQSLDDVSVEVEPARSTVVLGEMLDIRVTVSNNADRSSEPLIVHIDITDPLATTSVDPEDWTATLSKPTGTIAPGSTATVEWTIQPISGGTFVLYAVALSAGADTVASSNVLEVVVESRRSLNPGGILPVAVGAPIVIGGLLVRQIRFRRRTSKT